MVTTCFKAMTPTRRLFGFRCRRGRRTARAERINNGSWSMEFATSWWSFRWASSSPSESSSMRSSFVTTHAQLLFMSTSRQWCRCGCWAMTLSKKFEPLSLDGFIFLVVALEIFMDLGRLWLWKMAKRWTCRSATIRGTFPLQVFDRYCCLAYLLCINAHIPGWCSEYAVVIFQRRMQRRDYIQFVYLSYTLSV